MIAVPPEGGPASASPHGRALVPFAAERPTTATSRSGGTLPLRTVLIAGVAGLAVGAGALVGYQGSRHLAWPASNRTEETAQAVHRLEDQVARLQGSVAALGVAGPAQSETRWRGLTSSVDTLKRDVDQVRSGDAAGLAALTARVDKADREPQPALADVTARLDRIEHEGAARPADTATEKLADLSGRLDRLERQAGAAVLPGPAPSAARAEVTRVPVTPAKTPDATPPAALAGWVLRDVYDGVALVEGRKGGLREVEPGEFLPGAGEVRSIERHGHAWVVLTSRGVIAAN